MVKIPEYLLKPASGGSVLGPVMAEARTRTPEAIGPSPSQTASYPPLLSEIGAPGHRWLDAQGGRPPPPSRASKS